MIFIVSEREIQQIFFMVLHTLSETMFMNQVFFNIQRTFNLTEQELEALNNAKEIVILDKNEAFLKEGEICNRVALIESRFSISSIFTASRM